MGKIAGFIIAFLSTFTFSLEVFSHPENCQCVTPSQCADGGGVIKPRNSTRFSSDCPHGLRYCCVIVNPPSGNPPCGVQDPLGREHIPGFIYGREDVGEYREFPWMAKILDAKGNILGTGVLIDETRILSVAHLFGQRCNDKIPTTAILGMQHKVSIRSCRTHEDFSSVNLYNDIAILSLEEPVNFKELYPSVNKICLPEEEPSDRRCILSTFDENLLPITRTVELPILSWNECQTRFENAPSFKGSPFLWNGETFICAGGKKWGQDACEGHGGSPLSCQDENGVSNLAGLVSWGLTQKDCRDRGAYPGAYVNVHKYKKWIEKQK